MVLDKLSESLGPSGYEGEVRKLILRELKDCVEEITTDKMGNIVAHKIGSGKKIALTAHMDEVGFIVTGFNKEGTLRASFLGDKNAGFVSKKVVLGENRIPGVIGTKAIHLQTKEERNKSSDISNCCIDIGANNEEDARNIVELGEFAVYDTKFGNHGEHFFKGKAFNGRVGCSILIDILKEYKRNLDICCVFSVQSLVGRRGAYTAAYDIDTNILINVDVVSSEDVPGIEKPSVFLDKGPVLSLKENNEAILEVAKKRNINYQLINKTFNNDSKAYKEEISQSTVINIGVPCRYVDFYASVISEEDYNNTKELILNVMEECHNE